MPEELGHHRRQAPGAVEIFSQMGPGRLKVNQERQGMAEGFPVLQIEVDAGMAGDGDDVGGAIRAPAEGGVDADGIEERGAGHDPGRPQILCHHRHDPFSDRMRRLAALAIGAGDLRRAGEGHPERLGEAVHRQRRPHHVAMADTRRRRGEEIHETTLVDRPRREPAPRLPDDRAGSGHLTVEVAVEHRATVEDERREIAGDRGHQRRRRRLVAASREDHAVERIAMEDLHEPQIGEIAIEGGCRPARRFLDRVHREDQRQPPSIADAVAEALDRFQMDPVAGGQIAGRLSDPDHRPPPLELTGGQPRVQKPLEIERGHAGIARVVPPLL